MKIKSRISSQEILDYLRKKGADPGRSYTFDFSARFPAIRLAVDAATALAHEGFKTHVQRSRNQVEWLCRSRLELVPSPANLDGTLKAVESITAANQGTLEGWKVVLAGTKERG